MCVSRIKRPPTNKEKIKADVELRFSFSRDFLLDYMKYRNFAHNSDIVRLM